MCLCVFFCFLFSHTSVCVCVSIYVCVCVCVYLLVHSTVLLPGVPWVPAGQLRSRGDGLPLRPPERQPHDRHQRQHCHCVHGLHQEPLLQGEVQVFSPACTFAGQNQNQSTASQSDSRGSPGCSSGKTEPYPSIPLPIIWCFFGVIVSAMTSLNVEHYTIDLYTVICDGIFNSVAYYKMYLKWWTKEKISSWFHC